MFVPRQSPGEIFFGSPLQDQGRSALRHGGIQGRAFCRALESLSLAQLEFSLGDFDGGTRSARASGAAFSP